MLGPRMSKLHWIYMKQGTPFRSWTKRVLVLTLQIFPTCYDAITLSYIYLNLFFQFYVNLNWFIKAIYRFIYLLKLIIMYIYFYKENINSLTVSLSKSNIKVVILKTSNRKYIFDSNAFNFSLKNSILNKRQQLSYSFQSCRYTKNRVHFN